MFSTVSWLRTVGRISVTRRLRYWFRGSGFEPRSRVSAPLMVSTNFSPWLLISSGNFLSSTNIR